MADGDADREALGDAGHEARECMACRGSGQVISNLGGTPKMVACPWCEGSGKRVPGIDAQARWNAERGPDEARDAGETVAQVPPEGRETPRAPAAEDSGKR